MHILGENNNYFYYFIERNNSIKYVHMYIFSESSKLITARSIIECIESQIRSLPL